MGKIEKQELKTILTSVILFGFIFGFDDGKTSFILSHWIANFILTTVFSLILVLIFIQSTKKYSLSLGIKTNFEILKGKRYGWGKGSTLKKNFVPWGIILAAVTTISSYGKLYFTGVFSPKFEELKSKRLGKKHTIIRDSEIAHISLIGPTILTLMGIFSKGVPIPQINNLFSIMCFSIAFCAMLPIPKLNGCHAYFGAPAKYISIMTLIMGTFYLTKITTPFQTIILGAITSILTLVIYYTYSFIPNAYPSEKP
jgi:hypothetical protein